MAKRSVKKSSATKAKKIKTSRSIKKVAPVNKKSKKPVKKVKLKRVLVKKPLKTPKKPIKKRVKETQKNKSVKTPAKTSQAALKKASQKPENPAKSTKKSTLPEFERHVKHHPHEIKNEDYMDAAQSSHFRKVLLSWKKQLLGEMERTVHHMQDEAANFPDPNDRATQEEEFSLELRARDRERKLIKKIDESLTNIDKNDYGYCEACGVEIGVKRLEARPTATLCIDCKTIDEIREKHYN